MENERIDSFFAQDSFAVMGVSRNGTKFGNMAHKELKEKGLTVYQINPNADEIAGEPCYRSLAAVPERVGAVIISVSPEKSLDAVKEAHAAGVRHIWIQQGAESDEAVSFAAEHQMEVISRRCVMMFAEPVESVHAFHRFLSKLFGRYPKAARA